MNGILENVYLNFWYGAKVRNAISSIHILFLSLLCNTFWHFLLLLATLVPIMVTKFRRIVVRWNAKKKPNGLGFLKMAAIREFPLWLETCVICSRVWSRIQHWWGHAWSPTRQPTTAVRWPQRPILIQASLNWQRKMSEVRKLFFKFQCHLLFSTEITGTQITVEVLEKLCRKKQMAAVRKLHIVTAIRAACLVHGGTVLSVT